MTDLASNPSPRRRNRRGEGSRLRDEIIDAATSILERTGSEYALSLRGIAREVGIAAPSISAHFSDLFEIIDAVTARETTVLYDALVQAALEADPVERLLAICRAYLRYGTERPARYRMLFGRRWLDSWEERGYVSPDTGALIESSLALAVQAIAECVAAGRSASVDPAYDVLVLWFALDGLVSVRAAIVSIDWPAEERLLVDCVKRLILIDAAPGERHDPVSSETSVTNRSRGGSKASTPKAKRASTRRATPASP